MTKTARGSDHPHHPDRRGVGRLSDWSTVAMAASSRRYGRYRFIRPEPQAMWLRRWRPGTPTPNSSLHRTRRAGGRWQFAKPVPQGGWPLAWEEVRFTATCTPFRISASSPTWPRCGRGCAGRWRGWTRRNSSTVRLHRRRQPRDGRAGCQCRACRCVEEIGGTSARKCRAVGHGRRAGALDFRRCAEIRPREVRRRAAL